MRSEKRSNALLVELLIVIIFFMLAATIVVQVFLAAHQQGRRADTVTGALNEAQSIADLLYAGDDPAETLLTGAGFVPGETEGSWLLTRDEYELQVTLRDEAQAGGTLHVGEVSASSEGKLLFTLPCTRYEEGQL